TWFNFEWNRFLCVNLSLSCSKATRLSRSRWVVWRFTLSFTIRQLFWLYNHSISRRDSIFNHLCNPSHRTSPRKEEIIDAKKDACHHRCSCIVVHRRSEEHTSELQSRFDLVCRLLLEKK